jgi:hypothetical protein
LDGADVTACAGTFNGDSACSSLCRNNNHQ